MQSVGEKLRNARLGKSLSLEDVYRATKIHPPVLEALEQDRAHNFLSFVYIKGFLKTYAQYLGLDAEKLLAEYINSRRPEPPRRPEVVLERRHKVFPKVNLFLIARVVSVVALVFVFVFYFRFVLRHIFELAPQTKGQKTKVRVISAPMVKTENLILEVKALDACWLRVVTDKEEVFQAILPKGKRERWQAQESIELRIGKPEALDVRFNGEQIDLKAAKVKKRLTLTHEGFVGK